MTINFIRRDMVQNLLATILIVFLSTSSNSQTPAAPAPSPTPCQNNTDPINPDRPGIADGSTVIGPQTFQIESGVQLEYRRSGATHEHTLFVPSLLRFGLTKRFEARIEGNTFTRDRSYQAGNLIEQTSGFAPASIGLKYQFYDSGCDHVLTLGTIARVFPPWGSSDFRPQHTTGDIRLAADWKFKASSKFSLNPNVGVARYEDDRGIFTAALFDVTLNYQAPKNFNPYIDVGVQSPEVGEGQSSVIIDGGLAYMVEDNFEVDASIGTRVHGIEGPRPFLAFGFSWRSKLGHGKKHH